MQGKDLNAILFIPDTILLYFCSSNTNFFCAKSWTWEDEGEKHNKV